MSGVEQPLTVGASTTLSCMTNILVSTIEWRGQSSTVLESATDQTVLNYTIDPVSDDLHGVQYMCRAVAEDGTEYTQTVETQVMGELCHSVVTGRPANHTGFPGIILGNLPLLLAYRGTF